MKVFSIGGSVVAGNLENLEELAEALQREEQVVAVTGAGPLADYIDASSGNESEKDLIGIKATRLHAQALLTEFEDANSQVPETPGDLQQLASSGRDVVSGGFVSGYSTDAVAATAAELLEAELYICTDVEGVYSGEPSSEGSELLEEVSVQELRELTAGNSSAGGYELVDGTALSIIERSSIPTRIMEGTLDNLENPERKGTEILF